MLRVSTSEVLSDEPDLFVAITEGVGMVLENNATAQIELPASLFYLLKVGDDVRRRSLNG